MLKCEGCECAPPKKLLNPLIDKWYAKCDESILRWMENTSRNGYEWANPQRILRCEMEVQCNEENNLTMLCYHEANAKTRNSNNANNYQRLSLSIKYLKALKLN